MTSTFCQDCGNFIGASDEHLCPGRPRDPIPGRITSADLFMEIARLLARRSTCTRGYVGAVLVKDRRVVATGYNGAPPAEPDCYEVGCDDGHWETDGTQPIPDVQVYTDLGCQRAIHAEANVIAWAARTGQSCHGATLYSTASPCLKCAQLILSAGITAVIYEEPYRLPQGLELLEKHIMVRQHLWTPRG